jgi:hypothetical protein
LVFHRSTATPWNIAVVAERVSRKAEVDFIVMMLKYSKLAVDGMSFM